MPLIPVRNKLIYPAGATPGFDPSHPAAQGIVSGHGFAGVASNNGFVNLVNGARGTLNTSPTSGIIGAIGPGLLCDSGNKSATFAGNLAANDTAFTVAGIVQHSSIGGNFYLFSNTGTTGKGFYFGHSSSSQISFTFNSGGSTLGTPGLAYAANTPYFIAASAIQSGANYIFHSAIKNLLTGAITTTATTQVSTGPAAASDGTYMVGNTPSGFQSLHGYVAAVMFAPSFLTRQQLLCWAEDPWSFWYPQRAIRLADVSTPAPPTTIAARAPLVRNRLVYPAGIAAGFDPSHPAAAAITMCAIPQGANFFDVVANRLGSAAGTAPTAAMHADLGPHVKFAGNGVISMPGHRAYTAGTQSGRCTIACIGMQDSSAAQVAFVSLGDASVNVVYPWLGTNTGNTVPATAYQGQTTILNTPGGFALGTPFFVATSTNVIGTSMTGTIVSVNLLTGATSFTTSSAANNISTGTRSGNFIIGGRGSANLLMTGRIAAAMASEAYLTPAQLLKWAEDPWSFWYPQPVRQRVVLPAAPTTIAARAPLVRNRLVYPAGIAAGFDPSHPLAASCLISTVAMGGSMVSLFNGKAAVPTGGAAGALKNIGPVGVMTGANQYFKFSGPGQTTDPNFTFGAICYFSSVPSQIQYIAATDSAASAGVNLSLNASSQLGVVYAGVNRISSTFVPATNTPYLLLASRNQTTANFVIVNLLTGQTTSSTVAGGSGSPTVSDGLFAVGSSAGGALNMLGGVAAVSFARQYNSLQTLLKVAQDPWSFWYPTSKRVYLVSSGAPADVTGTFAAVETADGAAFVGDAGLVGTLAATETADAAAFNAAIVATGTLAATEAKDTAAFNAAIIATGTLAASETADTAAFVGGIIGAGINANLAAVETADNAAFAGAVTGVAGTLAATEAKDTAVFTGAIFDVITGTLAATEAKDTAAFAGVGAVIGILAATETADTAHFSSAKVNQIKGLVAQQSPVLGLVAQQSDDGKAPGFIAQYRP